MPWNGSGAYSRDNGTYSGPLIWTSEASDANPEIQSSNHDTHDQDISDGVNACLAKNGENAMTGNFDVGGFTIVNGVAASADNRYMLFGQMIQSVDLTSKVMTLEMPDNTGQIDIVQSLVAVMDGAGTDIDFDVLTNILSMTVQAGSAKTVDLTSITAPQAGVVNTVIPHTGGGLLTALRINELRDGNAGYLLPLANSVLANQIITINLPSRYATGAIVTRSGSDTVEGLSSDTSITFLGSTSIELTSDGVSEWSI